MTDESCPLDLSRALAVAEDAARAAGALLRAELHRPGGPRGTRGTCPADPEAEALIRDRLLQAFPGTGFHGEEDPALRVPAAPGQPLWLVDPHDGTSATHDRIRGAAVSIALMWRDRPVLGVVYSFAFPDDRGDLIAWAEGCGPLRRNGRPLPPAPRRTILDSGTVIAVSHRGADYPRANAMLAAPGRFLAVPSIAYRLALVAAGEADVAVSINAPFAFDVAGGHALLRGAGLDLYGSGGAPVRYRGAEAAIGDCFGGPEALVRALCGRPWSRVAARAEDVVRPRAAGRLVADADRLARAQGCLLGQLAGDALGALVEFQAPERIHAAHPDGVRDLVDGGTWNTLAGQPTDDSELALALARTVVAEGGFVPAAVLDAYVRWHESGPFDIGNTTRAALSAAARAPREGRMQAASAAANPASQANGALMRVAPIGILAAGDPARAAALAAADSGFTHPHPTSRAACAAFTAAIAVGIAGGDRQAMLAAAHAHAGTGEGGAAVRAALDAAAADGPPADFMTHQGWVLIALRNAFAQLAAGRSAEEGIIDTVARGGDTDTNAAIAGALLGAADGRDAIPLRWRRPVFTCRALPEAGARRPRPAEYWPDDVLALAESLLAAGQATATS